MATISKNQLLSAIEQVFAKTKSKYCKADRMVELLVEQGLTPEEANQAISLAEDEEKIEVSYPYVDEIRGERSYKLLTEEDRKLEDELEEELYGIRRDKQREGND